MNFNILYRGYLSSCNYRCNYCPFAKQHDDKVARLKDREALTRFVNWVCRQADHKLSILFTPWGEALIRKWYQEAIVDLSQQNHVHKLVIQTNLSAKLDWLKQVDRAKVALWVTYHPTEIGMDKFLSNCDQLLALGINFSVGMVGLKTHVETIKQLRQALDSSIYMWVNAYKMQPQYYEDSQLRLLSSIDPLFENNLNDYRSYKQPCYTGEDTFSVMGDGTVTRCHFIKESLGNIYQHDLMDLSKQRLCSNTWCDCHIGYVHLKKTGLRELYGDGLLERTPNKLPDLK